MIGAQAGPAQDGGTQGAAGLAFEGGQDGREAAERKRVDIIGQDRRERQRVVQVDGDGAEHIDIGNLDGGDSKCLGHAKQRPRRDRVEGDVGFGGRRCQSRHHRTRRHRDGTQNSHLGGRNATSANPPSNLANCHFPDPSR